MEEQLLLTPIGTEIKINGFVYLAKNGEWYLSSSPKLKSCCIENKEHILLLLNTPLHIKQGQAATIQGILEKVNDRWVISNSCIYQERGIGGGIFLIPFFFYIFYRLGYMIWHQTLSKCFKSGRRI